MDFITLLHFFAPPCDFSIAFLYHIADWLDHFSFSWLVVHVFHKGYHRLEVINNGQSSVGYMNYHVHFLVVLFKGCRISVCFFLFLVYDIEKLCCVHWIESSRCCCSLTFRMQPRLYFSLLRSNIEKLSNIHYDFFFALPFDIRCSCLPRILIVVISPRMLWVVTMNRPHRQVRQWRHYRIHCACAIEAARRFGT